MYVGYYQMNKCQCCRDNKKEKRCQKVTGKQESLSVKKMAFGILVLKVYKGGIVSPTSNSRTEKKTTENSFFNVGNKSRVSMRRSLF